MSLANIDNYFEELELESKKLKEIFNSFYENHPNTANHCIRVSKYSKLMGISLNFSDEKLEELIISSLFHDIGKKEVPITILHKNGSLTNYEFEEIKKHPKYSVLICEEVLNKNILKTILYHHEDANGTGYYGLTLKNIPFHSQIIRICDSFDAITTKRCYKESKPLEQALQILKEDIRHQYNQNLILEFLHLFQKNNLNKIYKYE